MDPLSVTASIIAILGAVSVTLETISSVRSAPEELDELLAELSSIQIVCCDAKYLLDSRQAEDIKTGEHVNLLLTLSQRSQVKFDEIHKLLQINWFTAENGNRDISSKLSKVAQLRWLKIKKRLKVLRKELREIRFQLATCVGNLTSYHVSQTVLRLDEARINLVTHNHARREEHSLVASMLDEQHILLERIMDALPGQNGITPQPRRDSSQSTLVDIPPPTQDQPQYARAQEALNSRCLPTCLCSCHLRGAVASPTAFHQAIGRLFVRYSCAAPRVADCHDPDCEKEESALSLMYYFPTWLCARRVIGSFAFSATKGPEFLLRVPNIVPSTSDVLNFARTGNVRGLKHLFANGLASPFDANSCGLTALHLAIHRGLVETSEFLIHAGADIYLGDEHDNKPIDTAWKLILSKRTSNSTKLEQLFSFSYDSNYAATRQFSTAHRAVLGLSGLETQALPDLIAKIPEVKIDATDTWGMTALAWAAQINDTNAISTLLCLGADPNKTDGRFYTPLMRTTDPRCMELLLDAGACIDSRDNLRQTALFAATQSPACVETLLRRGAAVDLTERSHGLTASHFCASNNRADSLRVLLRHGADFRVRAADGSNLLHTAAKGSDVLTIEVLVEAAGEGRIWDTHATNNEGATFQMLAQKKIVGDNKTGIALSRLLVALEAGDERRRCKLKNESM